MSLKNIILLSIILLAGIVKIFSKPSKPDIEAMFKSMISQKKKGC